MSASNNGHVSVVQLLADKGAKLDLVDKNGMSALIWASSFGHTAVVQLLADKGANLDLVDKYTMTALIWASCNGHAAVAQLLAERMDATAINHFNRGGKTALDYAEQGGEDKDKVAELAPAATAMRARGGLTGAELAARA